EARLEDPAARIVRRRRSPRYPPARTPGAQPPLRLRTAPQQRHRKAGRLPALRHFGKTRGFFRRPCIDMQEATAASASAKARQIARPIPPPRSADERNLSCEL